MATSSQYQTVLQGDPYLPSPNSSQPSPSYQYRFHHSTLMNPPFSPGSSQLSPLKPYHNEPSVEALAQLNNTRQEDDRLKTNIRRLRIISRVISFLISTSAFVPIALTLHKFLSTCNVSRTLTNSDGKTVNRTAWANGSKAWPTYFYFTIALIGVVLQFSILLSYLCSVARANKAAIISDVFSWAVMIRDLAVWAVATAIYRREKGLHGKNKDLWGWTCSSAARDIQEVFAKESKCSLIWGVQTASWYSGLIQVGAAALSIFIHILAFQRMGMKKKLRRQTNMVAGFEPVRH